MMSFIVSFDSTTDAMMMHMTASRTGLPGRIIPLPRQIAAGCGMAWAAPASAEDQILGALAEYNIPFGKTAVMEYGLRGRYEKRP